MKHIEQNLHSVALVDIIYKVLYKVTKFVIKIFAIDFVNEMSWYLTFWHHPEVTSFLHVLNLPPPHEPTQTWTQDPLKMRVYLYHRTVGPHGRHVK